MSSNNRWCRFANKYKDKLFSKQILENMMQKKKMIYFPKTDEWLVDVDSEEWINENCFTDNTTERILLHWTRGRNGIDGYVIKHIFDLGHLLVSMEWIEQEANDEKAVS